MIWLVCFAAVLISNCPLYSSDTVAEGYLRAYFNIIHAGESGKAPDYTDMSRRIDLLSDEAASFIAQKASDDKIAMLALFKIQSQENLLQIVLKAEKTQIRKQAFYRLGTILPVFRTMLFSPDYSIRYEAFRRLYLDLILVFLFFIFAGEKFLISRKGKKLLKLGPSLAMISEKIDFLNNAYVSAVSSQDVQRRVEAVLRMENEQLKFFAINDPEPAVRLAAAEKISDFAMLAEIIRKTEDDEVFRVCTGRVRKYVEESEQMALSFLTDKDLSDKEIELLKLIHDQDFLIGLYHKCNSEKIRKAAVMAVTDQKFLETVAADAVSPARLEAIDKVRDDVFLKKMLEDSEYSIRKTALLNLYHVSDAKQLVEKDIPPDTVSDIAVHDLEETALLALSKITEQHLVKVIRNSRFYSVRKAALSKYTGTHHIDEALSILEQKEKSLLQSAAADILENEENWELCRKCSVFISDRSILESFENRLRQNEFYRVWSILKDSLYARRFFSELKILGFIDAVRENGGITCTGKEGQLTVLVSNQYIYYLLYTFSDSEKEVLVYSREDGAGKVVSETDVFSILRKRNNKKGAVCTTPSVSVSTVNEA